MKRKKTLVFGAVGLLLVVVGLYLNGMVFAQPEVYEVGSEYMIFNGEGSSMVGEYPDPNPDTPKGEEAAQTNSVEREIVLGYTCTGTEALFNDVLPGFQKYWEEITGEKVKFTTGWNAIGPDSVATTVYGKPTQVQILMSIMDGKAKGFEGTKWKAKRKDIVYSYPQVFVVRKGNPKNILTYADLVRPEVQVLHVDPYGTHGGIHTVFGLYGAILKESEEKTGQKDYAGADEFVRQVEEKAITRFAGRFLQPLFDRGIGDVWITIETRGLKMVKSNPDLYEMVVPPNTFNIDMIAYKDPKNISSEDRNVINAFINYLFSEEAQEAYARGGFRPSDPEVLKRHPKFVPMPGVFDMDYLGQPSKIKKDLLLGTVLDARNNKKPEHEKIKVKKLRPEDLPKFEGFAQQALPE